MQIGERPHPEKPIDFERLKDAYAIIDGIPAGAIHLDRVVTKSHGNLGCGTIACAAGWLMIHPTFGEIVGTSLKVHEDPSYSSISYREADIGDFTEAMQHLFNLTLVEARRLFAYHGAGGSGDAAKTKTTHKKAWLARVRTFLDEHGQLNPSARAQ